MAHYNIVFDMFRKERDVVNNAELLKNVVAEEKECASQRRPTRHRGSIHGHNVIQCNRFEGHERLYHGYFVEDPVYPSHIFRRRFRMSRDLFLRIQNGVEAYDEYFVQRRDVCGVLGLSSLQKITAVLRMLAYGASVDSVDDYMRIGESTVIKNIRRFVDAIVALFGEQYLRSPNNNDINRLLEIGNQCGFPGMLGSIDCMHWRWKNCPTAWHGMFTGHIHEPTIILETVASQNLWIWHANFGMPGLLNDINVLERSSVFHRLLEGRAPPVNYLINSHNYTMRYYLVDGIYPTWSTTAQESARKDVERVFGVLQQRFAIV